MCLFIFDCRQDIHSIQSTDLYIYPYLTNSIFDSTDFIDNLLAGRDKE